MTNKLTKKGLAFATSFAFVASALVGIAPVANAAAGLPVSLLPAAGTAYDSIRQSGFTFKSQFDTSEFVSGNQSNTGFWFNRNSSAQNLIYKIEAANGENLRTDYFGAPDASAARGSGVDFFEAAVNTTGNLTNNGLLEAVVGYESTGSATNNIAYIAVYRDAVDGTDDDATEDAGGGNTSDIPGYAGSTNGNAFGEWPNIVSSGADVVVARITAPDATTNLTLKVTAFLDESYDGRLTFGEQSSTEETTTLFSDENVTTGTSVITSTLSATTMNVLAETTLVPATINPYMVATASFAEDNRHIATRLYKNGEPFDATYTTANVAAAASTVSSVDKLITTFPSVAVTQGTYTARSFLTDGSSNDFGSWVTSLGAANGVVQGTNADVNNVYARIADTGVVLDTGDGYDLKTGEKSFKVSAQITTGATYDGTLDLEAAGVRVRMTVTYGALSTTSKVTVAGNASEMTRTAQTTYNVFATTNAAGKVEFTINNSEAKDADNIDLTFSVLKLDGSYSGATANDQNTGLDIVWDNAFISGFATDAQALSSDTIGITYDVTDQFGGPISNDYDWSAVAGNEVKPLSVTVVAYDSVSNSQVDATTLRQTVAVTNGKATVSFANFAPMGGHADVKAFLHRTTGDWNTNTLTNTTTANANAAASTKVVDVAIYKNDPISGIITVPAFSTEVNLGKFYTGNLSEDDVLLENALEDGIISEDAGSGTSVGVLNDYVLVSGTVETTKGYGAAAQQVTISGSGLLFRFNGNVFANVAPATAGAVYEYGYDDILQQNSATFYTDTDGTYSVYVYAHNVNTSGQTVTISSGGKSTTVLLKTYLNYDTMSNKEFHNFTWNFPKYPGKGVVVSEVKLTDKWNNVIPNYVFSAGNFADIEALDKASACAEDAVYEYQEDSNPYSGLCESMFNTERNKGNGEDIYVNGKNLAYVTTNKSGTALLRIRGLNDQLTDVAGAIGLVPFEYTNDIEGYSRLDIDYYNDINGDGDSGDIGELFSTNERSYDLLSWSGYFGVQATARAGAKAGVVNVSVFNADGKKVTVKVGNKTVTATASGRVENVRVKGVKSGTRVVTVKVGKTKVLLTKFVSVK